MHPKQLGNRPLFIMLVGLPCSGKSTWTNNFMSKNPDKTFVIISHDNIIEEMGRDAGYMLSSGHVDYRKSWSEFSGFASKKVKINFRQAINNHDNIIHDQTNMSAKVRRKFLSNIPKEYYKICVVFNIPEPELKRRLKSREEQTGKHVPDFVIRDMANRYDSPTKQEGFDEIQFVSC